MTSEHRSITFVEIGLDETLDEIPDENEEEEEEDNEGEDPELVRHAEEIEVRRFQPPSSLHLGNLTLDPTKADGKTKTQGAAAEIGVFDFDLLEFDLDKAEDIVDYSMYENRTGLAEDMKFLASMPELCDITFLVGT